MATKARHKGTIKKDGLVSMKSLRSAIKRVESIAVKLLDIMIKPVAWEVSFPKELGIVERVVG